MRTVTVGKDRDLVRALKAKGLTAQQISEICHLKPGTVNYLLYHCHVKPENISQLTDKLPAQNNAAPFGSEIPGSVIDASIPVSAGDHTYEVPIRFKVSFDIA